MIQFIKNLFPLQDKAFYILRRILVYEVTVPFGHSLIAGGESANVVSKTFRSNKYVCSG
jgi:hypothetical protein